MATTTNYGWTTPDNTDLVKDGASAIRTLGSSIDTTTKALNPSTTLGDIEYRSSTANTNTRLGIGSTGQILTVAGGVPTWAAPAGKPILQIVSGTYSTQTTIQSTSLTDSGLSLSITPTASTSKILVLITQPIWVERLAANANSGGKLTRGATDILNLGDTNYASVGTQATGASIITTGQILNISYLDSPATTSSVTYKTRWALSTTANSAAIYFQYNSLTATITLLEIGA